MSDSGPQELPQNPYQDQPFIRLPPKNRFMNLGIAAVMSVIPAGLYAFKDGFAPSLFDILFGIGCLLPAIPIIPGLKALTWGITLSPDGLEISGILSREHIGWSEFAAVETHPHMLRHGHPVTESVLLRLKNGRTIRTPVMAFPYGQYMAHEIYRRGQLAVY